jgi:hypothetical protein
MSTKLSGTNVAAPIVPFRTGDTYPTHEDQYGAGGFRAVRTIVDRDSIPSERRRHGMRVNVWGDSTSSNNTDWEWNAITSSWNKPTIISQVETYREDTLTARNETLAAKDATLLNTNIYPNTSDGISATVNGQYFAITSSDPNVYLTLYKNNSGVAQKINEYPSLESVQGLFYTVENTLYVTKNGSDLNDGTSLQHSLATINKAFELIEADRLAKGEIGYDPESYVVIVHPGQYPVNQDTIIPRNTALYGYDLRATSLYIGDTDQPANMFKMSNGIKVRGFTFLGMKHESAPESWNLRSSNEFESGKRYRISTEGYVSTSPTNWAFFAETNWQSSTKDYAIGEVFTAIRSSNDASLYQSNNPGVTIIGDGTAYDLDNYDYPPEKGWVFTFRENEFITRSPYLADCSQLHNFTYEELSLPIDRLLGNPDMPRGGGNLLADGSVLDKYSPLRSVVVDSFTAINPNGYGYLIRKNALVQLVSVFTNWSRYALWSHEGGHLTVANSNNTFGDYAMVATGFRWIISLPDTPVYTLGTEYDVAANAIEANIETLYEPDDPTMADYATDVASNYPGLITELGQSTLITQMWSDFITPMTYSYTFEGKNYQSVYSSSFTSTDAAAYKESWFEDYIELFTDTAKPRQTRYEFHTKRDAKTLLTQLANDLKSGQDRATRFFINGVFDWNSQPFFLINDTDVINGNQVYRKGLHSNYHSLYNVNLWPSFRRCFIILRNRLNDMAELAGEPMVVITKLISFIIDIFDNVYMEYANPASSELSNGRSIYKLGFPSTIEAASQQFSYSGCGVNYNSLPYAQRGSGISPDPTTTLIKIDGGRIYATFSSESGDTYLGEDLKVDFERSTIEGQAFSRGVQNIALPLLIGVGG